MSDEATAILARAKARAAARIRIRPPSEVREGIARERATSRRIARFMRDRGCSYGVAVSRLALDERV